MGYALIVIFGYILYWWVRTTVQPSQTKSFLSLEEKTPVLYALPHRSIADLLVLDRECLKASIPRPNRYWRFFRKGHFDSGYFYLDKLGFLAPQKIRNTPPTPLVELMHRMRADPEFNVQMVPVSIVWGRNPGRNDRYAWLRFLFTDDENAGILQKLLIVVLQGKNVAVHFGKPIWMRELLQVNESIDASAIKLRRVLRVHFRTQRNIILGPKLYDRPRVIENLIASNPVQQAIQAEALASQKNHSKIEQRARKYLKEISSAQSHAVLGFFDILLSYLWHKKFNGQEIVHQDRLRSVAPKSELVYAPSHRSHFDYLLIGYVLYYLGMTVPHTGAGINLNFWPVGPLLRRGGAFFFWRSFKGNRLYTTVFTEYIHYLLSTGYAMTFFPEGGRSRTGRLLAPKTGMLAMVVHSFIRDKGRKPYFIIPVFIAYDRIPEIKTYHKELRGSAKSAESAWQLFKALKVLTMNFGKAYISYGEPIELASFLQIHQPDWKRFDAGSDLKPKWLNSVVDKLAYENMVRTNNAVVVYPIALISTILLATPQRAMVETELQGMILACKQIFKSLPYALDAKLIDHAPEIMIRDCEKLSPLTRATHPTGDVLYLKEDDGITMSYYRNNILHVFALPSLLASIFQHNDSLEIEKIHRIFVLMYPMIEKNLFLNIRSVDALKTYVDLLIKVFVQQSFFMEVEVGSKQGLKRADPSAFEAVYLKIFSKTLSHIFERFAIAALILRSCYLKKIYLSKEEFESKCQLLSYRVSVLGGVNQTEFYDKALYQGLVASLIKGEYLQESDFGQLAPLSPCVELAEALKWIVGSDVRDSLDSFEVLESKG